MRLASLTTFIVASLLSTLAVASDIDEKTLQCRNGGPMVLASWYQLDICLKYKKTPKETVVEARKLFSETYPKIKLEVDAGSAIATRAKEIGNAQPFDFSDNRNSPLLTNICASSIDFLHLVATNQEWITALSCWR